MNLTREALIAIDVAILAARHACALARLAHDADPSIAISDAPIAELTALGAQPTSAFMLQPPQR